MKEKKRYFYTSLKFYLLMERSKDIMVRGTTNFQTYFLLVLGPCGMLKEASGLQKKKKEVPLRQNKIKNEKIKWYLVSKPMLLS